jgi:hypothetical protein
MIEGKFEDSVRSEAVRFSHGDFGFVIQALNDAAGEEFLGAETKRAGFAWDAKLAQVLS